MKSRRFQPLMLPGALLALGLGIGALAEMAVGRFQNYGVYGLARPVADLVILIGGVWLVVAAIIVTLKRHG